MKLFRLLLLLPLLSLIGCGGDGVDTDASIADVEKEAASLTVDDLKAKASSYKAAIASKLEDIEPIKEKLAAIPLTEQMGDEAKALQADIADLTKDLGDLKERLGVYLEVLKSKGEEVKEFLN